jgi:hypothetical protein
MTGPARYLKSDPHFFRPVERALLLCVVALLAAGALVPAPLDLAADPSHSPNPARSAWFLLWIQELVSYSVLALYAAVALAAALVALPWLPRRAPSRAAWFQPGLRSIAAVALAIAAALLVLTIVALFFRGANWQLVSPFSP